MKNTTLQNELHDLLGDRFSQSISVRTNYAGGEDVFDPILSEAVVFPQSNEEISSIVKLCNKHKTSIEYKCKTFCYNVALVCKI